MLKNLHHDLLSLNTQNNSTNGKIRNNKKIEDPKIINIYEIKKQFERCVLQQIRMQEQLRQNQSLQRCLKHNNVFTLYCQIDRKPLCANCMFQNSTHRKHRVVPLSNALKQIENDVNSFQNKLNEIIQWISKILGTLSSNVSRTKEQYPIIIENIKQFFSRFHNLLEQKQKQQLQHIKDINDQIQLDYFNVKKQLDQISWQFLEKMRIKIKASTYENQILMKRNTFQTLIKTKKIIPETLIKCGLIADYDFRLQSNKLAQVQEFIKNKLTIAIPFMDKINSNFTCMQLAKSRCLNQQNIRSKTLPIKNKSRNKSLSRNNKINKEQKNNQQINLQNKEILQKNNNKVQKQKIYGKKKNQVNFIKSSNDIQVKQQIGKQKIIQSKQTRSTINQIQRKKL